MVAIVTLLACILGAIVQSVSGIGFGMTVVPIFAAMFDPSGGVMMGNLTGFFSALVIGISKRKDISWKRVFCLTLGAIPGIGLTLLLLSQLDPNWVNLVIGGFILLVVPMSLMSSHFKPVADRNWLQITSGVGAGVLSATVAQSGPIMTAYAQSTRLSQRTFSATTQPFFVAMNLVLVPSKMASGLAGQVGQYLPDVIWALLGIAIGTAVGKYLSKIITAYWARTVALMIATLGGLKIVYDSIVAIYS